MDPRVYPVCTRIVCPWFRRGEWEITARAPRGRDRAPTSLPRRRDLGLTGLGHRPPALDASSRSSLRSTQAAASSRVRRGVGAAHRRGGVCRTDRCGGLHCDRYRTGRLLQGSPLIPCSRPHRPRPRGQVGRHRRRPRRSGQVGYPLGCPVHAPQIWRSLQAVSSPPGSVRRRHSARGRPGSRP